MGRKRVARRISASLPYWNRRQPRNGGTHVPVSHQPFLEAPMQLDPAASAAIRCVTQASAVVRPDPDAAAGIQHDVDSPDPPRPPRTRAWSILRDFRRYCQPSAQENRYALVRTFAKISNRACQDAATPDRRPHSGLSWRLLDHSSSDCRVKRQDYPSMTFLQYPT